MPLKSPPSQVQSVYIKALSSITTEIMQKNVKDNGVVGVDDGDRWLSTRMPLDFSPHSRQQSPLSP